MKAWLLPKLESIAVLQQADVPDPTPARGEVVIDVQFAALNPADRYLAEGQYPARPALPAILGRDGIGAVAAVGEAVRGWNVGDVAVVLRSEVGVNRPGLFAQKSAVPVESLVRPPAGWTAEQAAAAPLVYLTAWQALTQWLDLPKAARVLITGASGGVGVAGIQLGTALGHTVVGMSRGTKKVDALKKLGAADVLDPADSQWRKKAGGKFDLAIDNIGGELLGQLPDVMADYGRISLVGRLAGPVPQFNSAKLFFARLKMGGVAVGTYTPTESQAAWGEIVTALDRTGQRPQIDEVFRFADLPAAFARLAEGPIGKVLLRVRPVA